MKSSMKKIDTKPCPFCGGKAFAKGQISHENKCWITLFVIGGEFGQHVEDAWNKRSKTVDTVKGKR